MRFDFNKYKQDLIIVAFFAILALAFCYPQLQGMQLRQSDNISWKAMAHEAMEYHDKTGKDVLWSNSMFGGMPTYTTYVAATNTNYAAYIQSILQGIGKPAYFFFIPMLCFFILMRVLKINKWIGATAAVAYAFSTYNGIIIGVGHETKMLTMGYLPAALAGLYLIYQEKWLTGAALLGTSFALIFANNHFQVIYYSFIMFACFGVVMLVMAIKEGKLKNFLISSGIAIAAVAVGIGPSTPSILTTMEYAKETMRGGGSELSGHDEKKSGGLDKEYAFRWSNGVGEIFCIMIPYLYGGASGEKAEKAPKTLEAVGGNAEELPLYWGPQPGISGPVYFGAAVCFLFVLGAIVVRSKHKWWILAATIICTVMSCGRFIPGINYFLFDTLPYLNKFRTPSMALVIPQFLFPILAAWALQEISERKNDPQIMKQLKMAAGITIGLCVVLGLGGSMFFDFTNDTDARYPAELVKLLREDRASLAMKSSFTSAFYILLVAGLIWAYITDKIKPTMLIGGICAIIAIDLIPVSYNYLNKEDNYVDAAEYESIFQPTEADAAILRDPDPYYRVLDLSRDTYNDAVQAYFHKCVGGYHPAKMEIYQDLIDRHMSRGFNGSVLNMLNTKYIIVAPKGSKPQVMPNPDACGNAWFVNEVKWANTADEEMNSLNGPQLGDTAVAGSFDPRTTAVIRSTFKNELGGYTFGKDGAASIKLTQYGLDDISFNSNNSQAGLAVFSDIYYTKGWKAYVDDKETSIIRANYVLRAIKVPAGQHKIEFRFRPESFYNGQKVAMVSSILILGLIGAAIAQAFRKPAAK